MSHETDVVSVASTSHLSRIITSWFQAPSPASLLHQRLLAQHHSLRAADVINPWLMKSPDVSLSPDSTVQESGELSSSDGEDVLKLRRDASEAVNLSQRPTALKDRHVASRSSLMSANISTSSAAFPGNTALNCHPLFQSQAASPWSRRSAAAPATAGLDHPGRHSADPVLNLCVKPVQLSHGNSLSVRPATMTPFSRAHNDNDSSGSVFMHVICGGSFVKK